MGRFRIPIGSGFFLLLLATIAAYESSKQSYSNEAAVAYNKGIESSRGGDLHAAEARFREAIRSSPKFFEAWMGLAQLLQDSGRGREAEDCYSKAVKLVPNSVSAVNALAFIHVEAGRLQEAEKKLKRVKEMLPASASALLNLGAIQRQMGKLDEAIKSYEAARRLEPDEAKASYNLGNAYYSKREYERSIASYMQASRLSPQHVDTYNNMANAMRDSGDKRGARGVLETAMKIDPNSVAVLCNLGVLYADLQELDKSLEVLEQAHRLGPDVPEVICSRANSLHSLGRSEEGISEYRRVVKAYPLVASYRKGLADMLMSAGFDEEAIQEYQVLAQSNDHEVAANSIGQLAALQNKKGEHGGAEQSYRKSIAMDPTNAQMRMNLAVILADQHRIKESFALFEEAIVMRPADHLTLSNFGTVLHRTGEFERSAQLYQRALQLLPGSANLHYNLGNSYMDIAIQKNYSLLRSAIQEYTECLSIQVTYPGAMNNLGNALKESDRFRDALRAWQTALRLEGPRQPDVFSNLVHLRMFVCDWDNWKSRYSTLEGILRKQLKWYETSDGGEAEQKEKAEDGRAAMMSKKKSVSCQPFHALLYAELDGDVVLKVAQSFAHQVEFSARHFRHFFEAATRFDRFPAFNDNKINVGYLSHDFGDHPTGHLFNGVPFLHQQSKRVRAFYFSLSGSDGSRYWKRLQRSTTSDQIADVTSLPFEEAASLINMRGIHVLVDLDVWMKGRRPEILALRPSPVQVVYLGYPGSSGAAYIDFLVSDKIVSPPEARALYSEHLVLLPGTYQVNDYKVGFKHLKQSLMREKELHTREFHELPKKGLLLGNFNQLYKIDPDTLDLWSAAIRKILSIAPASLWLLRFPSIATSRLIKELKKRGIERHQVHFSDRISKDSHLLRVHMADIFLDNHHVNAHTTASEAIWAGVPLVTWPGVAMASRVAASLLMSTATVSCLIARTQEDFLELVFALAISHHRRRALRQSMMQGSDLFDTERWVSSWETSLRLMVTAGMYAERGHVPHIVARRSS